MMLKRSFRFWLAAVASLFPLFAGGQTLSVSEGIQTYPGLTNTTVTMTGRCELRITATNNPMPGCVIHLNSPDAWLVLPNIRPSVAATYLSQIRVNGANAVSGGNVRVDEFAMGTVVVPHAPSFRPLQVFSGLNFLGASTNFGIYIYYTNANLGSFDRAIRSFKLKRGYMATFAQRDDGGGASQVFVAQDGDLEVGVLTTNLDRSVRFVRVFPWRWTSKKGWAGGVQPLVRPHWSYDWDNVATSTLDAEYVPMRHNLNWNAYANINAKQRSTHALGFNEPDQANQADMTVDTAIANWPNLVRSGLRVGAPAVSDSGVSGQGLSWLYGFMDEADALGYRVDFVPVHFYKCDWTATQYYNWLLGIYQRTGRPVWVTEFNNGANWCASTPPTLAQNATRISEFLEMLENAPFVERYAIYNWVGTNRAMVADDGTLTPAGVIYRDRQSRLAYAQTLPQGGSRSIAQYQFETNTLDSSGFANNGFAVGIPGYALGRVGQAVVFDGTKHFIRLPPNIANSAAFSFAAWVYWEGGGNWQRIFDFGNDTTHYLFLTPSSSSGTLRFAIRNGGGEQLIQTTGLPTAQWQHVAITVSGNTARLYTNGVLAASSTSITIAPSNFNPALNYLGESQFSADPLFRGRLDEVLITDYVLSAGQIAALQTNLPPQFASTLITRPNAAPGLTYGGTLAGEAIDPNPGDTLIYTKLDGPAWLTIAPNGSFSGTPASRNAGVNRFMIRVADAAGASAFAMLTVEVDRPPGFSITPTLISVGAVWRYFDGTNDLGTSWRSRFFNDTGWSSGAARLGYGNDGEVTTVASNRQWTTYFRRQFYVGDPNQILALNARLSRDDAAVIYLNGTEVWRDPNITSGTITYTTAASTALGGADETDWLSMALDPTPLVAGWNALAAEVHNQSLGSSDIGFDFELDADAVIDPLPSLKIARSGRVLVLSWPAAASYFALYSATNLAAPIAWTPVTTVPELLNGSWTVSISLPIIGNIFFRLQIP
jgi:putative glycosyl hydrolase/concanavalin A-like lectin/glucanase superfamily protein/putative Ig domain-containing protein